MLAIPNSTISPVLTRRVDLGLMVAHAVTMGWLIKSVLGEVRSNSHRLKQDVKSRVAHDIAPNYAIAHRNAVLPVHS